MPKETKPRVVGITGAIASGKSYVAEIFRQQGAVVRDSDKITHQILSGEGFEEVSRAFPEAIVGGELDRGLLGEIVFAEEQKLSALEAIIHPLVRKFNLEFIEQSQSAKLIVLEIPLLFETGAEEICDYTVFVNVSRETISERALARPGMTAEKLEKILSRQMPVEEKMQKSDFVIDNEPGTDTVSEVTNIIGKICEK